MTWVSEKEFLKLKKETPLYQVFIDGNEVWTDVPPHYGEDRHMKKCSVCRVSGHTKYCQLRSKKCVICGTEYSAYRQGKKTCSKRCQQKVYNLRKGQH